MKKVGVLYVLLVLFVFGINQEIICSQGKVTVINGVKLYPERTIDLIILNDTTETNMRAIASKLVDALQENQLILTTKYLLNTIQEHKAIEEDIYSRYLCKEVDNYFVLFIPKSLHIKDSSNVTKIFKELDVSITQADMFLGLKYTHLNEYDYHKSMSVLQMRNTPGYPAIGSYLVTALQKLLITRRDINRGWFEYESLILPFCNLLLSGHGSKFGPIASIGQSDFFKILQLFEKQLRTKSLTISTCYSGGKKFKDMAQVTNIYNQLVLENITYPVLFKGSFFSVTSSSLKNVKQFFAYLNNTPPEYMKAMISLGGNYLHNYTSIKFPRTSWIEQDDYDKKVKKLSQVEASVKDEILIKDTIKGVLLSANIIKANVILNIAENMPTFLPVNYNNQHYLFDHIIIKYDEEEFVLKDLDHEEKLEYIHEVLYGMFFRLSGSFYVYSGKYNIDEPITIFIKKLTIKNSATNEQLNCTNIRLRLDTNEADFTLDGKTYTDKSFIDKAWSKDGKTYVDKSFIDKAWSNLKSYIWKTPEQEIEGKLHKEFKKHQQYKDVGEKISSQIIAKRKSILAKGNREESVREKLLALLPKLEQLKVMVKHTT